MFTLFLIVAAIVMIAVIFFMGRAVKKLKEPEKQDPSPKTARKENQFFKSIDSLGQSYWEPSEGLLPWTCLPIRKNRRRRLEDKQRT